MAVVVSHANIRPPDFIVLWYLPQPFQKIWFTWFEIDKKNYKHWMMLTEQLTPPPPPPSNKKMDTHFKRVEFREKYKGFSQGPKKNL